MQFTPDQTTNAKAVCATYLVRMHWMCCCECVPTVLDGWHGKQLTGDCVEELAAAHPWVGQLLLINYHSFQSCKHCMQKW